MPTYLVQVALPAIYVIDAKSPHQAMAKAAKRFQHEYHTHITLECQWAQLKGSANHAEWKIVGGEDLVL
jgi:murein endopeptidase